MIPDRLDLCFGIPAKDVRERVRLAFRKEGGHSRARENLLRIRYPLQHPVGPQALARQLEIRSEVIRRLAWRNNVTRGMAALALELFEQVCADLQPLRVRVDIRGDE